MKNLVGLWANLSRAYEVAMLGNFSVQILFDKEYKQGFEDYENIKSFYDDVGFVKEGNLPKIELFAREVSEDWDVWVMKLRAVSLFKMASNRKQIKTVAIWK